MLPSHYTPSLPAQTFEGPLQISNEVTHDFGTFDGHVQVAPGNFQASRVRSQPSQKKDPEKGRVRGWHDEQEQQHEPERGIK